LEGIATPASFDVCLPVAVGSTGGMGEPEIKIIDVFICKLRKWLSNASGGKEYIETVWGRGYNIQEPSERLLAG
jgi:Transcriptional regulatory protein, C terminal